ncbi:hypothetical protein B0H14DRAFT_2565836 [Mycena olivaceomarginata]|nr:hypothetical protein B0H14DRAFT_2565836 [Mycena olivaceomarginata]
MHGATTPNAIIKITPLFNDRAHIPIQYNFPLTEQRKILNGKSSVHHCLAWERLLGHQRDLHEKGQRQESRRNAISDCLTGPEGLRDIDEVEVTANIADTCFALGRRRVEETETSSNMVTGKNQKHVEQESKDHLFKWALSAALMMWSLHQTWVIAPGSQGTELGKLRLNQLNLS